MGGDLMSLLRQDVRLPEASIHDFGRDMVVALQVGLVPACVCPCNSTVANSAIAQLQTVTQWPVWVQSGDSQVESKQQTHTSVGAMST